MAKKEPKNGAAAPAAAAEATQAAPTSEQPAAAATQAQDGTDQAQAGPEQPTAGQALAAGAADAGDPPVQAGNTADPGGADDDDEADMAEARAVDAARAAQVKQQADAAPTATLVPMDDNLEPSPLAKELLLEATERWGIVPTLECDPRELLGWRFVKEDTRNKVPAHVVVKTCGGLKLRHYEDPAYMDPDTEEILARTFNAYAKDPKTKEIVRLPLPEDQALPPAALTGFPTTAEHSYRRGYLREGGKTEAAKRQAARKARK